MDKKIVSTFMFSEPHEQELLWLKFNVEDSFISEWIVIESEYTFQGKRKEKYFEDILIQPRFERFANKIKYIALTKNSNFAYEPSYLLLLKRKLKRWLNDNREKKYELVPYAELASFYAEITQRGAALSYLRSKYAADDIIILCDTDEIFDFNGAKGEIFNNLLRNNATPFYIKRAIFCYDFDNLTLRDRYSPIVRLKDLKSVNSFHEMRHPTRKKLISNIKEMLAYEYTFCFEKDAILKKLGSFAHVTDLDERAVDFCLRNNIALVNPNHIDNQYKCFPENYYNMIDADKLDMPAFLQHNFEHFKTSVVSKDYIKQRELNKIEQVNN